MELWRFIVLMADGDGDAEEYLEELTPIEQSDQSSSLLIPLIVGAVNLIAMLFGLIYLLLFYDKAPKEQIVPDEPVVEVKELPGIDLGINPMEKFTITEKLEKSFLPKHISLSVWLEFKDSTSQEEFNQKEVVIRDKMIFYFGTISPEDTVGLEGKITIKEKMIYIINNILTGSVINIYFNRIKIGE